MAALSSALLCLGALGCLWGPTVAFVDFQGRYFITAFLENGGAEKPSFRLYVSPPTKGPPTAVQVRAQPVGGQAFRRALSLQPGTTALVRLPSAVELRGSRRAAGGAVRLAASRPVGVTVVNARGRTSLDTALALPRRLLGTRYVVVTPSLQPHDRHKEFAVVAGAWPTRLRLTPPVPILLDGVEHAAGRPLLVRLEPFQALQVQSAGDLSGTRVVATQPVALLAGHSCLQARNKACGHVSEQLLPQDYWGRVYAVPPFAPAAPGPKDHVYVVADGLGSLSFWGGGAEGAQALRSGVVMHFAVDPVRPLVLRSSAGLQVLFLAAAAARGGVAYKPFFALLPPVDAFSRSFALTAQPGFSNVAVLLAREPTPVLLDQQPLPNLHWRLIPGGPEPRHGQHSGESQAAAPGFVWTEVAYGPEPGVVHFLETRGLPVGVLSFGTGPGAGFGTQAMGQPREAEPESKPKTVSKAGSETISAAKLGLKVVAVTDPGLEAVTMAKQELETVAGSKMVSEAKSETLWIASSGERQPMHFVTMRIFGVTITAVKHEFGFVQVNQQRLRLPATLHDGRLRLHFRSSELWAEAGLEHEPPALRLVYDWQHALSLQVTNGYRAHLVGLCGNFNGDPTDDVGGPDPRAFLRTWALQPPDAPCHALWAAPCAKPAAPPETPGPCAILAAPKGPFSPCHDVLLPAPFETSCSAWICPLPNYRPALCLTLQFYAHACQRLGVSINSWRFQTGCPIECPHNSHYEPCGSSCPETCMGRLGASCPLPCGETCACDAGYVHSGPDCVLRRPGLDGCGCTHQGRLLGPGETLWEGVGCTRRCVCPASGGSVICTQAGCRPGERCILSLGLRTCVPSSMGTCVAAGGGHYITFDGRRFRFPGSCVYLLSGLSSPAPQELADFRVLLGTGPDGLPGSLEVLVSGCHLRLDPKEPGRVLVNGDWQNLPFQAVSNSTLIFRHGWDTVVSCPFGLRVTYAPGIRVVVDLPAAYMGHVVGLCADYNGDPMDDLQVPGIVLGTKLPEDALVWAFGHSYLVGSPTGCPDAADKMPPLPPSCVTLRTTSTPAHFAHICDILLDPLGPFQLCHEMLAPGPYVQDCMVDVCLGIGPCPMLSLYCETCQLLGGQVFPWRKSSLCRRQLIPAQCIPETLYFPLSQPPPIPPPRDWPIQCQAYSDESPLCPAHSRYTLCAPACSATCAGLKPPPGCDGPGLCREGCVCDAGFLLSGADCVPAAQCGCLSAGRYLEPGAPLSSPHPATSRCCRCRPGGRVVCKPCRSAPGGPGLCLASDGLRYRTFDGTTFHLPGACTSSLVSTGTGRLRGVWPFEVVLEKSPRTPERRRALLCVHGHRFGLDWEDWGYITVDGVRRCLPFQLTEGRVRAFARGASVVLAVRGGPRLLFGPGGHLSVELPAAYRGLTRGLCGNFNGKASDDLQLPRPGPCAAPRPCPGSGCPPAAEAAGADAAWRGSCGLLREPGGPLAPCHALLPPEPFFQACVADMGRAGGNRKVLCAFLQAYVAACQTAGADMRPWRAPSFCPMRCLHNSHYSLCVNPCPAACPGVQEVVQLPTPCAEGCECEDGFFPAGRDCVPADHCPCFHHGQYFPPGQTVLIQNCSSSCTCQLGEGVACVPFSCPVEEVCGITDGVLGCRLQATLAPVPSSVAPPLVSPPFPPLLPSPSPQCPENSRFVPCGSACPATCANPAAPDHCSHPCAPTCQCLPGYLLLGGRCVPRDHCSCFLHQGRTFWRDNCTQQCHCPTLGALVSKLPQCWPDKCHGHCKASTGGWYHCLLAQSPPGPTVLEKSPVCMATGDFHFHTFGGTHYEFPGSCVYRLVGLCGTAHANLQPFSLDLTPLLRPRGWTKALTLLACGLRLDMSPKDLNHIRVDGILESLPFFHGHCLRAYYQGRQLCVDTDFGLSLTYDWDSLARVTLPRLYGPYLCGLCGQHGPSSPTVQVPDTWKVAEVPGCGPFCGSLCPSPCPVAKRILFAGDAYCGLLAAAEGPFGPCYAALDPLPFMDNCLDDVCRHYGARHIVCRALAAFTVACQALGVHLRPWRTPDFCPLRCPPHSHYELCGPCCPVTCAGRESCPGRGASGSRCCEGCVCDAGFVLSGAACVREAKCGCFRAGRYRALEAVWYPGPRCARRCHCGPGGAVTCAPRPCRRGRVCGLRGGERQCLPEGRGSCALAGPAHVLAFDGRVLTLPPPAPSPSEPCLHVLARTASRGPCPFSLDVARDGAGLLSLHLNLSGHHLQLDRTLVGVITVDGEHCQLPWVWAEGRAWATLEGRHVVVYTACGLHLMYDWGSQVRLTVPSTFHGQLVGICGAFGGKVGPLDLPLDKRSWPKGLVTNPCPLPQPNLDFSISCPTQLAQIVNASKLCRLLRAPDGPFGRCLGHISPRPFLRICLQDICHTHGQHLGLCDALTAFTAACQEAGIPVKLWRGPKLCPMVCPPRSHYSICARTCDGGCVQPTSPAHCSTQCYEGCQCDPGLIFDGTDCVSQDHCGCFDRGRYIPVGEALVLPGCQERCMCLRGQGLQCQPFSCPQGTGCILDGGVRCCEAGEGATCRLEPGGLFITFDGFSGLTPVPVTSCAYELATLVGSRPEDPDWFHVIADFLPCPGCTAHKPRVIIGFRDGCAAVGTNQEIWVNGQPARLPAQVCRGVVARWAEGSRVVIERSPTLRVLVGPEGAVALRASPALRGRLRAACGDYNGIAADDLILPGGLRGASLTDVFQACRARGFSNCTEKLVMPAVTQHFTA
uniref:IgGFc-binding protein-like n=1 Tax=Callorhinus ursinus TaxID=34884 RepID=A0A3Q7MSN6_CALUR|nr:IgGFc-binding protein-like [Callorhinus ursinus]